MNSKSNRLNMDEICIKKQKCIQDVCISLEVADPTSLPAAISKVLRVVATLPRLERFVGDVCEVTPFVCSTHHIPKLPLSVTAYKLGAGMAATNLNQRFAFVA